ncbi:MAG TPA: M48 family metallopeptidase [Blastocatellia bacterium]|nr:M48 family metallopeptidase [Blastocatellia bacterium]
MRLFQNHARLVALLSLLVITAFAAENVYNKFRNRSYSNRGYLSEAEEVQLGAQVHNELRKQHRFVTDPAVTSYINSLGQRLANNSKRSNLRYQFFVVDDKSLNAFATLGGYVYVHSGLIRATETEAQLAAVIGHEIGHIVGRHGLENVKQSQKYGTLAAIAGVAGAVLGGRTGGNIGQVAGNLIFGGKLMKHSRDAEREADYLGLYNLQRANYNTRGMVQMFEMLESVSARNPNLLGNVLASHPPARERAGNTVTEIRTNLRGSDTRGVNNSNEFQRIKARLR